MSESVFMVLLGVAATVAAIHPRAKTVLVFLWVSGLLAGALFLDLGYEVLAVFQWIISTLMGLLGLFYFNLLGELDSSSSQRSTSLNALRPLLLKILTAGLFAVFVYLGTQSAMRSVGVEERTGEILGGISRLGEELAKEQFLSGQMIGLAILLLVIGTGVIVRPEKVTQPHEEDGA